jgi:hypothetical protein
MQYPPIFSTASSSMSPQDAYIGQGIANMRFEEMGLPVPSVKYPMPLEQEGQEVMRSNFVVPTEPGEIGSYGAPVIRTDTGAFPHELTHAYQSQMHPDLDEFVNTVIRLARSGDPVAQASLQGYGPVAPQHPSYGIHGAYQGSADPQHLFTWFIDNEMRNPGSTPAELREYYAPLIDYDNHKDLAKIEYEKRENFYEEQANKFASAIRSAVLSAGSLRGGIEQARSVEELANIFYGVSNLYALDQVR